MLPATISARKPIEQKTEQNKNVQQVDSNVDCRATRRARLTQYRKNAGRWQFYAVAHLTLSDRYRWYRICWALHAPVANIALWIFHTLVALVFFFMYGVPTAIAYYTPFVLFEAACTVLIA
jgi:hypothetical protein